MAVRIIEFGGWGSSSRFPSYPSPLATQTPLTATTTSQQSAVLGTGTSDVLIDSDEDVHVAVGSNPTATTGHMKVKAGYPTPFAAAPGYKVAVRLP